MVVRWDGSGAAKKNTGCSWTTGLLLLGEAGPGRRRSLTCPVGFKPTRSASARFRMFLTRKIIEPHRVAGTIWPLPGATARIGIGF